MEGKVGGIPFAIGWETVLLLDKKVAGEKVHMGCCYLHPEEACYQLLGEEEICILESRATSSQAYKYTFILLTYIHQDKDSFLTC